MAMRGPARLGEVRQGKVMTADWLNGIWALIGRIMMLCVLPLMVGWMMG